MEEHTLDQKVGDEIKFEAPTGTATAQETVPVQYETEFAKKQVGKGNKDAAFRKVNSFADEVTQYSRGPVLNNLENAIREVDKNDKQLKAILEGKRTLWENIKLTYAKMTGSDYKEKEILVDAMIRNAQESVSRLDSKLSDVKSTQDRISQYYEQKQAAKTDLEQVIANFKGVLGDIDFEAEKYKRDYNKAYKAGDTVLAGKLELETDHLYKDKRTIGTQLEISANKYILLDNTSKVLDALSQQVDTAVGKIEVIRSQAQDYIIEITEMKGAIISLSEIAKCTVDVMKYKEKLGNILNQSMDIVSKDLLAITGAINTNQTGLYTSKTTKAILGRTQGRSEDSFGISSDATTTADELMHKPGKYADKENE